MLRSLAQARLRHPPPARRGPPGAAPQARPVPRLHLLAGPKRPEGGVESLMKYAVVRPLKTHTRTGSSQAQVWLPPPALASSDVRAAAHGHRPGARQGDEDRPQRNRYQGVRPCKQSKKKQLGKQLGKQFGKLGLTPNNTGRGLYLEAAPSLQLTPPSPRARWCLRYILRPEAVEGWWYMYELTGEDMYRDWGWKTFLAFERHLKVTSSSFSFFFLFILR